MPRPPWLKCSILTASPPTQSKCPLVLRVSWGACLQLTNLKNKAGRNIKTKTTTELDQIMGHTQFHRPLPWHRTLTIKGLQSPIFCVAVEIIELSPKKIKYDCTLYQLYIYI